MKQVNKNKNILVSVCIITYNQEKYISEAIKSVLSQKVNFDFEIIVYDDCSNDQTSNIIGDLIKKYPKTIFSIRARENKFSKGIRPYPIAHKYCRGKFIAHCDGDDFWNDDFKLQKQVELLQINKSYSACVTNGFILNENQNSYPEALFQNTNKEFFTLDDLMDGNPFLSCTAMYRKSFLKKSYEIIKNLNVGDYPLYILAAQNGNIGYLKDITATYRIHTSGDWQGQNDIDSLARSIKIAKEIRAKIIKDYQFKWKFCKYIGRLYGKLGSYHNESKNVLKGLTSSITCFFHPLPSFKYRYKIIKQIIVLTKNSLSFKG